MRLSQRFADATAFALQLHDGQLRKGTRIPYVAHLLAVAGLVLEHGGTESHAIAALLHDAVEDAGGVPTLVRIRERFGAEVAEIVGACSDSDTVPKPPWRGRKERYLAHLAEAPAPVVLVSASDKLHNARAILSDYRELGEAVWSRFNAGRDDILWYYRAVVVALRGRAPARLVDELARVVGEIDRLAGHARPIA